MGENRYNVGLLRRQYTLAQLTRAHSHGTQYVLYIETLVC